MKIFFEKFFWKVFRFFFFLSLSPPFLISALFLGSTAYSLSRSSDPLFSFPPSNRSTNLSRVVLQEGQKGARGNPSLAGKKAPRKKGREKYKKNPGKKNPERKNITLTPRGDRPHPSTSSSGSDHIRSHIGPSCGTSCFLSSARIASRVGTAGLSPPCPANTRPAAPAAASDR